MPIPRPQRDAIESVLPKTPIVWNLPEPMPKMKFRTDGDRLYFLGLSRPNNTLGCNGHIVAVFGFLPPKVKVSKADWRDLQASSAAVLLTEGRVERLGLVLVRTQGSEKKISVFFYKTGRSATYPSLVTS